MRLRFSKLAFRIALAALVVVSCFVFPVRADIDPNPEKALVGNWVFKDPARLGGYIVFTVRKPDGTAAQLECYVKGPLFTYSDLTWKTSGQTLTDVTVRCTALRRPKGESTASEIVSLDAKSFTSRTARGETRAEIKIEALPEQVQAKMKDLSQRVLIAGIWQYKSAELFGGFEGYSVTNVEGTVTQIGHALKADKWLFFEANWKVEGGKIKATITRSNLPPVPVGATSENELVSVDDKNYTYVEGTSGAKRTETRVEALPADFQKKLAELQQTVPIPTPAPTTPAK